MQPKKHYLRISYHCHFYCVCHVRTAGRAAVHLKSIDKTLKKRKSRTGAGRLSFRIFGLQVPCAADGQEPDPRPPRTDRPTAEQKRPKLAQDHCRDLHHIALPVTGAEELIDCPFDLPTDDLLPHWPRPLAELYALWTGLRMDRTRSWNACWTRSATTTSRWTPFAAAGTMQRGAAEYIHGWCRRRQPQSLPCGAAAPQPPAAEPVRTGGTSTPPFCSSCGRPTMPFLTR